MDSNIFDVFQSSAFFLQQAVQSLASGMLSCLSDMAPVVSADSLVFGMTSCFKPILCVFYPGLESAVFQRSLQSPFCGYFETTFWVLAPLLLLGWSFVSRLF